MEKEAVQGQRPETPTSEKQVEENSPPGKETKGETQERGRDRENEHGSQGKRGFKQGAMKLVSATKRSSVRTKKFIYS